MAWRFKASKYKNSTPIVPKPELCIREIVVGSYQTYGNVIAASGTFMAFNYEHAGSSLAILPIDDSGRKPKTMPMLHAHSDTVSDFEFSPFHDNLLATGSQDGLVKIWHIPEEGLKESISNAECTFSHRQKRVEKVGFHPTVDLLLHSTSGGTLVLHDLSEEKELYVNNDHPDVIQSLSWKQDGTVLATNSKDKKIRVLDPRCSSPFAMQGDSHQNIKDSRVVWLGNQDRILTTGFDSNRIRQVIIRDTRNFNKPEKVLDLDCSTGILMPLFDPDTNMLFLAGKGDTTISFLEVADKDPYLVEGIRHSGEQTKGACILPKRCLRVMEGEVNRVLQLTSSSVIPITYQVPRKTYRDFHSDIFPDTNDSHSELLSKDWIAGKNVPLKKVSLDPTHVIKTEEQLPNSKGNLKMIVSNIHNSAKNKETHDTKVSLGFVPMRNRILQDQAKTQQDTEEFILKHKSIAQKFIENYDIEPKIIEEKLSMEKNGCHSEETDNNGIKNGKTAYDIPPKPLPRKSISEQGSFEDSPISIPKPKPRTSNPNLNYKTRLGPKPFSTEAAEVSFDKVFAVPSVPSGNSLVQGKSKVDEEEDVALDANPPEIQAEESPDDTEQPDLIEDQNDDVDDQSGTQQNSIADRRKLYESRSLSLIEEKKKTFEQQESSKDNENIKISRSKQKQSNGASGNQAINNKRTVTVFGKVSKFRHLKGTTGHKSTHIENVKNISRQISNECDGFHANPERVAVPLAGSGGKMAVFELSSPGKLSDGVIPSLVNASNVTDFQWNPFDHRQLVVACDDGKVKIWTIPDGGLNEPINTPSQEINAHSEKIQLLKFHPLAKNVLITASFDMTLKVWNLETLELKRSLKGHTDQIFSFAWSSSGKLGATACKDGKIRIYDVRSSEFPIKEGIGGPVGNRGARIIWCLEDNYLVITGFDKVSERQIYIFKVDSLDQPIGMVGLDVSPAILIPFYDEDSSTLFLTGRGDTTIYCYEVTEEAPYFCPLSHHRNASIHQGLSFLQKNQCDVKKVEFARLYRLTNNSVEPISFAVPRVKSDFFQDDLFPPTRVTWTETVSADEWFAMKDRSQKKVSLQPENMIALSSTIAAPSTVLQLQSSMENQGSFQTISEDTVAKQEILKKSISDRVQLNYDLEQNSMEGVDDKEWEE